MFLDKYTLENMLISYRDTLADENALMKYDIPATIDAISSNEELINSINKVLNGEEKLVIDTDLNFK